MQKLGRLREILNPGLIENWKDEIVILREKDKCAKLKEVKIKGLIEGSLVLKMDRVDTQTIFKGNGFNKKCDYLILTRWKEKKYALFIELKSRYSREEEKDYKQKFNGAQCLFESIDIVLNRFILGYSILERFERRLVVVYKSIPLNKRPTRLYTPIQESITSSVSFRKIQYREVLNLEQLMA